MHPRHTHNVWGGGGGGGRFLSRSPSRWNTKTNAWVYAHAHTSCSSLKDKGPGTRVENKGTRDVNDTHTQ